MSYHMIWYVITNIYTHTMEYCSSIKRWNLTICKSMDEPRGYYANIILFHVYLKSKEQNKLTNQMETDS